MKKSLLLLFLSLPVLALAQDVDIPDANFLSELINDGVDTNGDGVIQVSEAEIVDTLNVSGKGINNLSGIEAFINITYLDCARNSISTLDLSSNTLLITLDFNRNNIQQIDLTQSPNLYRISCYENELEELDLSNNTTIRFLTCQKNNLQNLDISNNPLLRKVDCSTNQLINVDVSSSPLLWDLTCDYNQITNIDLTNNANLRFLRCRSNNLEELILSGNPILELLICSNNNLGTLNLTNNPLLNLLYADSAKLDSLNLTNNPLLEIVLCRYNNLQDLDVSQNPVLQDLWCSTNFLSQLDLSNNPILKNLICSGNNITEIDLSLNPVLDLLHIGNNNLTLLNVSHNPKLNDLSCSGNYLDILDVSKNPLLVALGTDRNNISNLDVSKNPLLKFLSTSNNNLTSLDISNNPLILSLRCFGNLEMKHLNIANGSLFTAFDINIKNDSLTYVCIDDNEYNLLESYLGSSISQVFINTYCNFSTLTGLNFIEGVSQYDLDGICNSNSTVVENNTFLITTDEDSFTFSPPYQNEFYNIFLPKGSYEIKPNLDSSILNYTPPFLDIEFLTASDSAYYDLCYSNSAMNYNDPSISITALNDPMPGEETNFKLVITNFGNQTSSGYVEVLYPINTTQIISSSQNYSTSDGNIRWEYTSLPVMGQKEIYFSMLLNSTSDTPSLQTGDILTYQINIMSENTDVNILNNKITLNQELLGNYNPNSKSSSVGKYINVNDLGDYIDYSIQFQNIDAGQFAKNITIRDTIDERVFDISSFRLTDYSHPVYVQQEDNIFELIFYNVDLSTLENFNEGFITYKIKTKEDLIVGDQLINKAEIYFDYEYPIFVDPVVTIVVTDNDNDGFNNLEDCNDENPDINPDAIEIPNNGIDEDCDGVDLISAVNDIAFNDVHIYPNPFNNILTIEQDDNRKLHVAIMDITGRYMYSGSITNRIHQIALNQLESGVYVLQISNLDKVAYFKVVKE